MDLVYVSISTSSNNRLISSQHLLNASSPCFRFQIPLNFFDSTTSSTASLVSCSDSICSSNFKTADTSCSDQTDQCGYQFHYADDSGTSGHYVTDFLHFDTVVDPSTITNSSASITFGCAFLQDSIFIHSMLINFPTISFFFFFW